MLACLFALNKAILFCVEIAMVEVDSKAYGKDRG